jgi:hypothetical protein
VENNVENGAENDASRICVSVPNRAEGEEKYWYRHMGAGEA